MMPWLHDSHMHHHACITIHACAGRWTISPSSASIESTPNTRRLGTRSVREGCHPQRCVERNITCIGCASFPCSTSTAKAGEGRAVCVLSVAFLPRVSGHPLCCGLGWKITSVMRVDVPAVERIFAQRPKCRMILFAQLKGTQ